MDILKFLCMGDGSGEDDSEGALGFYYPGRLEVHVGCMKSGKSEAFQLRFRKLDKIEGLPYRYQLFKPKRDVLVRGPGLSSRMYESAMPAITINENNPKEIMDYIKSDIQIIGIEEIQFFNSSLEEVVYDLAYDLNKNVVLAGLDFDFKGDPFPTVEKLFIKADYPKKHNALCEYVNENRKKCHKFAYRSQRLLNGKPAPITDPIFIEVDMQNKANMMGDVREYYPVCYRHHIVPDKKYH